MPTYKSVPTGANQITATNSSSNLTTIQYDSSASNPKGGTLALRNSSGSLYGNTSNTVESSKELVNKTFLNNNYSGYTKIAFIPNQNSNVISTSQYDNLLNELYYGKLRIVLEIQHVWFGTMMAEVNFVLLPQGSSNVYSFMGTQFWYKNILYEARIVQDMSKNTISYHLWAISGTLDLPANGAYEESNTNILYASYSDFFTIPFAPTPNIIFGNSNAASQNTILRGQQIIPAKDGGNIFLYGTYDVITLDGKLRTYCKRYEISARYINFVGNVINGDYIIN